MKGTQWNVAVTAICAGLLGGAASNCILVTTPVIAQTAPVHSKVLRTERLELLDHVGKMQAFLEVVSNGTARLYLGDLNKGVSLSPAGIVVKNGENFALLGPPEHARGNMGLIIITGGSSMAMLGPEQGSTRVGLFIQNPNGQTILGGEAPSLTLLDLLKKPRATICLSEYGTPYILLSDQDKRSIWSAP